MSRLTHLDDKGAAHMVDVGGKDVTERVAVGAATVRMLPQTLALIDEGGHAKGDVLAVARIAGIQAAKQTSTLIPLCHPLMLNAVDISFEFDHEASALQVAASCRVSGKTGVEMEALTAVSVAALTIYDMCKAVDRGMRITDVELRSKSGGKSGAWQRDAGDGAC